MHNDRTGPQSNQKEIECIQTKNNKKRNQRNDIFFQLNSWPGVITDFIVRCSLSNVSHEAEMRCNATKRRNTSHFWKFYTFIKHAAMHSPLARTHTHTSNVATAKTKTRDKTSSEERVTKCMYVRERYDSNLCVCTLCHRGCMHTCSHSPCACTRRLSTMHSSIRFSNN